MASSAARARRREARIFAGLALCLFLAPTPAATQTAPPADTITAGVIEDWPPYFIRGANGLPAGFAIDVLDAVAASAGLTPLYRVYPSFGAAQEALHGGEIDVIANLGVVPEREFLFTSPVNTFDIGVFVRRSSPRILTHEDLHGKVAVVESNIGVRLTTDLPNAEAVLYADVREALFRLLAGDVDALIYPSPVVWALARSAHVDHQITNVPPALIEVKRAIAVSRGRGDLHGRLDEAVRAFVGSREYELIYRRWHEPPAPFWTPRRVALVGLVALIIVALAGAIWRYVALRKAHERIRFHAHLLNVIGEAVIATDLDGKVLFWNRFAEELYGWKADEAMGRAINELTTPQSTISEAAEIMEMVRSGKRWQGEFLVARRDGRVFPALVTNEPIFDRASQVIGVVGVSSDLSARKHLEEQLLQAQKMESIGRLAGGVAHDFNNLLTVISGTTEVVMSELSAGDRHRDDLEQVRRAAERAATLTQQLLAFSRKQIFQPQVLNLNGVLHEAEHMLRRLIGEDVTLIVRLGKDLGHVRADPTQLQQVILNLAINSRDAMPAGGRLTIETANVTVAPGGAPQAPALAPGDHVMLVVSDTGSGMDEATRRRLFEPFFTTKAPGRGTGLGLATVYGIVQQSGGTIDVESRPGAGTTFRIWLPRVNETADRAADPPTSEGATGSETILLVEDEPGVRDLVLRTLKSAGYKVLAADQPAEALRVSARHDGQIHLLLTDVVLPGMHGPALVAELARARPETRVLYMSGYAESAIMDWGVSGSSAPLIHKPFTLEALVQAVRQVLDARAVSAGRSG